MPLAPWFGHGGVRPEDGADEVAVRLEDGSDEGVVRLEELGDVPRRSVDITYVT